MNFHGRAASAVALCAVWTLAMSGVFAKELRVDGPNRDITITIASAPNDPLTYSVQYKKKTALLPSTLGIVVEGQNLGQNVTWGRTTTRNVQEKYATRGVHSVALNRYRETDLAMETDTGVKWWLEMRVFGDGLAYRYRVPGSGKRQVGSEVSAWRLPTGSTLWYQSNKNKSYEAPYEQGQVEQFSPGTTLATPATVKLPNGAGYAMMTEANLINYSDMALQVNGPNTFSALFDNDSSGWTTTGEIVSPWRVTLLTPDLNGLVNSDIIRNLCPPPAPALVGADWIQPGRSTWHWLITGSPKLEQQRQWVDWTKQLGFEYYIIDDGWKRWQAEGKDAWACLKDVADYARSQNVRVFAWVNSHELLDSPSRLAYFQKAKAAGVVGLKIDFPHEANAEWVQWYDDTLREAAQAQLMVDFHGAVKPTGRERTWPNELTREAVRGRENGKQSPLHDTALPFVRYVQGSADFTPGEFRADHLTHSSWAHELAQAVVYTSPLLCFGGSPEDYLKNPAVDVIKALPATWDETVVLPGSEIGKMAAFARRKGDVWFIGVINGDEERPLPVNLGFLDKGTYRVEQFGDSPERPDGWSQAEGRETRKGTLMVNLRPNGGFVARLTPVKTK